MTNTAEQTLASIVTAHHQAVPVLEKYSLDFCCKGKRTLTEACNEKGLEVNDVLNELNASYSTGEKSKLPFTEMNAEQLISYILIHHHFYVKQSMPATINHLEKVAAKHGDRFPYMKEALALFIYLKNEMLLHMHKEEMIVFPHIKEIASVYGYSQKRNFEEGYINVPLGVLENEHDEAGEIMFNIRRLTNNYTPPEGACTTFKVSLAELKEFEEDLHQHVHLENNILFPLAKNMLSAVTASV